MSVAFTSIKGLTFYNTHRAYKGVTLLLPVDGREAWLIDMMGRVVHHWDTGYKPGHYAELLPNGNLLYAGKIDNGSLADLEGAGGILLEVDWEGNVIWKYQDPYLHHTCYRMKNGNTLALKWIEVPKDIAAKVKGGVSETEREGVMWGDAILEISPHGRVVWEWIGHEHLAPELDSTCSLCPRSTWTHANGVVELPDGNVLISFMKNNTLAIIDKKTGNIKWRWGLSSGELAHQHCPTVLDNGNILVFDNGLHPQGFPICVSRVIEINPDSSKMVWCLGGGGGDDQLFYSSAMSSCQRLPNGNTFICEGTWGRLFEVTPAGELVWEYVNNLPSFDTALNKSRSCPVYCAYRYGMDYSGLKRPVPVREERQDAPGTAAKGEGALSSRLAHLGY